MISELGALESQWWETKTARLTSSELALGLGTLKLGYVQFLDRVTIERELKPCPCP